jgi:hypothetical protein
MGSISDQTDTTHSVEGTSSSTAPNKLDLSGDEIKFLLAKIAQLDFKGVEIEFAYTMIVKLQELYRQKNQ